MAPVSRHVTRRPTANSTGARDIVALIILAFEMLNACRPRLVNSGVERAAERMEVIPVKSYIVTTGGAFGLLALAHIARMFQEGANLITEPVFLVTTVGSIGVCFWAIILLKRLGRPGS